MMTHVMNHKKGISPVVSWILILMFTMTIAMFVTRWYLERTEDVSGETLKSLAGGIECNEVNINVAYTGDATNCEIKVANTGSFKVDSIRINEFMRNYSKNPKEYLIYTDADISGICASEQITVIPILKRSEGLIRCPNDRIYERQP